MNPENFDSSKMRPEKETTIRERFVDAKQYTDNLFAKRQSYTNELDLRSLTDFLGKLSYVQENKWNAQPFMTDEMREVFVGVVDAAKQEMDKGSAGLLSAGLMAAEKASQMYRDGVKAAIEWNEKNPNQENQKARQKVLENVDAILEYFQEKKGEANKRISLEKVKEILAEQEMALDALSFPDDYDERGKPKDPSQRLAYIHNAIIMRMASGFEKSKEKAA